MRVYAPQAAALLALALLLSLEESAEGSDNLANPSIGGRTWKNMEGRRKDRRRQNRRQREERRQQRHRAQGGMSSSVEPEWLAENLTDLWAAVRQLQQQHSDLLQLNRDVAEEEDGVSIYGSSSNSISDDDDTSSLNNKMNPQNSSTVLTSDSTDNIISGSEHPCHVANTLPEEECRERTSACLNPVSTASGFAAVFARPWSAAVRLGKVCSDHGECCCGECLCDPDYGGRYCECPRYCPELGAQGEICSGHGHCSCGMCKCVHGWTGAACSCTAETATCNNTDTGAVCSDQGNCVCGMCFCQDGFFGATCDQNSYDAGVCEQLKPCVLCGALGMTLPQCRSCDLVIIKRVPAIPPSLPSCRMVHSGCLLHYSYDRTDEGTHVVSVPEHVAC